MGTNGSVSDRKQGSILLAATPIGNPGDATQRLRDAIVTADLVAAEDTRRFRNLCSRLGIEVSAQVVPLHDHNEAAKGPWLVERALSGDTVLVVSDAGTPTVSDPGYQLVKLAERAGVRAVPLPGPSAALAALSVSGLPTDRFVFEGFLPRKRSERRRALASLASEPRTVILFESPRRTAQTLADLAEAFGSDRPAALCRELTKTYESVVRAGLGELAALTAENEVLGEVTVVVGGYDQSTEEPADLDGLAREVLDLAADAGVRLKDAAAHVAERHGVRKNQLMELALKQRAEEG